MGEESPIGKEVQLHGYTFEVIGLIQTDTERDWRAYEFLFPFASYERRFPGQSKNLQKAVLRIYDSRDMHKAKMAIERFLQQNHRGVHDFALELNEDKILEARSASYGIHCGSLVDCNCISFGEWYQCDEYHVCFSRRSNARGGAQKSDGCTKVGSIDPVQFGSCAGESIGALPGIAMGATITMLPDETLPLKPILGLGDYLLALLFAVGIGFTAGLFPAIRASSLQPVEALRY